VGRDADRALAASMGCTRATVSTVSDTLERSGLVARAGDAEDRRLVQLDLTPAGRALIEDVFPRFNAGESALVAGLSPDERELLAGLLRRLVTDARGGAADRASS
jgi:DNA-binding MarR family transcriptional regulator